jgi:hypothetical protein
MRQTKWGSLFEAVINTLIGFAITMVALPIVNHICGIEMNAGQMSVSTAIFTAISILRGYLIRRFFDGNIAHAILKKFYKKDDNN